MSDVLKAIVKLNTAIAKIYQYKFREADLRKRWASRSLETQQAELGALELDLVEAIYAKEHPVQCMAITTAGTRCKYKSVPGDVICTRHSVNTVPSLEGMHSAGINLCCARTHRGYCKQPVNAPAEVCGLHE